jgi:uncharacterized beta barrel domain-containing protein DUF5777
MQSENKSIGLVIAGIIVGTLILAGPLVSSATTNDDSDAAATPTRSGSVVPPTPSEVGVSFVDGSSSQIIIEREGKKYLVDVVRREIKEVGTTAASDETSTSSSKAEANNATQSSTTHPASPSADPATANKSTVYSAGDDLVFNVPTGRRVDRHGLYINFTHRFPYEPAFTTPGRGNTLLGLDDFAIPSFGFRYGITSRLYAFAYRSPSVMGRPIELMVGYNVLDEHDHQPLNLALRFSVDGQNNFQRNFAENFELIASRSITRHAQIYAAPTLTIHARPLLQNTNPTLADAIVEQPCSAPQANGVSGGLILKPCANTFSLGVAASVDIRKTVALVAETIPTLWNAEELGIHRPEFAFGVQKKIWRHAFTLGFGNGPATIVSQRAGSNATFTGNPSANTPRNMFIGFDLTRQIF